MAIRALCWRELTRFYRDRGRVLGALGPPLLCWLFVGGGLGSSFRVEGVSYLQYFFPGTVLLAVLFTSIFANISVIEDRHEGFLQSVLVAPVPRLSLVLGKVLGGAAVGFSQGLILLALSPAAGFHPDPEGYALACAALALCAVGLGGLGFAFAWMLDSVHGFHSVMSLVLIPMWLASGALFAPSTAAPFLRLIISLNPLSYAVSALHQALVPAASSLALAPPALCLAFLAVFAAAALGFSAWTAREA